jgi:2-polyprenyl-6-methoxyphenol hydroxylase-like FAD-dependent oxidoreductase
MLACRRTTFEWVLRRTALNEGNVTFRTGTAVDGLIASEPATDEPPLVTGVHLADGSSLDADLVVVANGRRSVVEEWVTAIGGTAMPMEDDDTGIVYLSRFYRLREGAEFPPRSGLIGGDLGYLKFGIFVGDNRTFSLTLAIPSEDDDLRKRCSHEDVFEAVGRQLEIAEPFLDGRADALTPVHVMAGLVNRWRQFVVDGRPAALGVHAIGDAVLCTNPLYGRGCTTGYWGAHLLAEAVAAHPDDLAAQAQQYDAELRGQIHPWYRASVHQDAEPAASPRRCSPARTLTATPPTRGRSCVASCAKAWHPPCASTRSCCGPSCAASTCCRPLTR